MLQEFLVCQRDVVLDYNAPHAEYLDGPSGKRTVVPPVDPQPAVQSAKVHLVQAEDMQAAAVEYIRSRGTSAFPMKVIIFGPGEMVEVDLATVVGEAAPA